MPEPEQGDVEAVRAALDLSDLRSRTDPIFYTSALAALDRLAAALERAERYGRLSQVPAIHREQIGRRKAEAHVERAERALAENEQMWEDMRAYNIRLEERAREAERALAEIIAEADELLLWQPGKKGYAVAHKRFYDAIYPYRSSEDTGDES